MDSAWKVLVEQLGCACGVQPAAPLLLRKWWCGNYWNEDLESSPGLVAQNLCLFNQVGQRQGIWIILAAIRPPFVQPRLTETGVEKMTADSAGHHFGGRLFFSDGIR